MAAPCKRAQRGGFTGYAIAADPTRDLSSIEECGGELRRELWSIMEGMSARSLRAFEQHGGASGGVSEHWRSMEEFWVGSAYISRRGEIRAETLC